MSNDGSLLKDKKQQNLAANILLFQIAFITVVFVATIAGLGWTTHRFIVEEGLKDRAIQLSPELEKLAAKLYHSDNSDALANMRKHARNITDILFIRYYNANDMKLQGQYVKDTQTPLPDSPSAQISELEQTHSGHLLLNTRTLGVVTSIRLLAPVHTPQITSDGQSFDGAADQQKGKTQAIGYIELAMDLTPTRKNLFKSIFPVSALLLTILVSFVIFSRRYIHNALNILLNSQNLLQRAANEDFNGSGKTKPEEYKLISIPETDLTSQAKNQFLARVLIADDNEINRKLAVILLSHIGANIDQAENGFEAVTACNHNSYDLILMDIHMPVMDGIEATKQIRLLQRDSSKTPIVALTANALDGDKERYIASGMDDYLAKPLTATSLQSVLVKWCPAAFPKIDSVIHAEKTITINDSKPADLPVLDPKQGIALAFGQVETWKTVLEMLLKSLPTLLNDIERAFDAKRMDEMHQFVHKLHGSSSYCGTPALQQASRSLEIACASNNINVIALQLDQVKIEMVALANLIELNGMPIE